MDRLIAEIKKKQELSDLPDSLIERTLEEYLRKYKIAIPQKEKDRKSLVKLIRAELRTYAGQYHLAKKRIAKNTPEDLMQLHRSTRERREDYPLVKKMIADCNPKSVLDLGCGLNPLFIAQRSMYYYAYDIKKDDLSLIKRFFEQRGIEGEVHHLDITQLSCFPPVDLCLLFKVVDILGKDTTALTETLLKKIRAKHLIVSFATRTLSGKPMNHPYRRWFEQVLKRLNYQYTIVRTTQELFYTIHVQQH